MTNRRLKKPVLYGIYVSAVFLILGTIFLIEGTLSKDSFKDNEKDRPTYVSDTIFSEDIPVVGDETKFIRPYTDKEIKIVKNYYDYQGGADTLSWEYLFTE